jgi:uncharacterized protein YwqG
MQNTSREILLEIVLNKMSRFKRRAWKPIVRLGSDTYYSSKFGGIPMLPDPSWPTCGSCGNPMRFFFQINSQDLPQPENCSFGDGMLQLFYCSSDRCDNNISGHPAGLPFSPRQLVRVIAPDRINYRVTPPEMVDPFRYDWGTNNRFFSLSLIVGWEEIDDYPNFVERESMGFYLNEYNDDFEIDDDEEYNLAHELCYPKDKLGGWPDWSNHREVPACPICGEEMNNFIFQIATDDCLPYCWGDCDGGYIFQCSQHLEQITFIWGN